MIVQQHFVRTLVLVVCMLAGQQSVAQALEVIDVDIVGLGEDRRFAAAIGEARDNLQRNAEEREIFERFFGLQEVVWIFSGTTNLTWYRDDDGIYHVFAYATDRYYLDDFEIWDRRASY